MTAPKLKVRAVEAFERDVALRLPFRFGIVTLRAAPQAFLRARVEAADGRAAWGHAAELMVPKWFDKDPALSNDENVEQLRRSVRSAAALQTEQDAGTAVDLAWTLDRAQRRSSGDGNGLVAGYGPALIARAVLDGLCRLEGVSFYDAVRTNRIGVRPDHLPDDLAGFDIDAFLAALVPAPSIAARHTVGLADALTRAEVTAPVGDGLPESLDEAIARYGHRYFKIKVSGDPDADLARLAAIADVLDAAGDYRVTFDGNEQFADAASFAAYWRQLASAPRLARLMAAVLYVEQPIHRAAALARPLGEASAGAPVIIDESDADPDSFVRAVALGYSGVSSKTCKGVYRSIVNAARCRHWGGRDGRCFFMSAEDLTTQAGVAVQQDLALAALLGLEHVERNGHHYVNGMDGAGAHEMDRFAAAHPDLYRRDGTGLHLTIDDGRIAIGSLGCAGFATAAVPDYGAMRPMS